VRETGHPYTQNISKKGVSHTGYTLHHVHHVHTAHRPTDAAVTEQPAGASCSCKTAFYTFKIAASGPSGTVGAGEAKKKLRILRGTAYQGVPWPPPPRYGTCRGRLGQAARCI
jgi:hypothetical protein